MVSCRIAKSHLFLMGKDSLKYRQTPPFLILGALSDLKGSGEKPLKRNIFIRNVSS